MLFTRMKQFFSSSDSFDDAEWILKYQISAILLISFFFGLGVLLFSFFRIKEGNLIVGISQLLLGIYLLAGFFRLRKEKDFYPTYSIGFMLFFFTYTAIIFFYVPQNHLNILWVISAPILIFFFLNRSAGVMMFGAVFLFILYLLLSGYAYTVAEYVTLIAAFLITTFVMHTYEAVKEAEKKRLLLYNQKLKEEVSRKTSDLLALTDSLEKRVEEELHKRLAQEQMLLQQCRMASMGEMIDAIAHQWRQPLMHINAILMNVDRSLETETFSPAYTSQKMEELSGLTSYMSDTIEDFRHLFRQEKERMHFDLVSLIEQILHIMKNRLKEIEVQVDDLNGKALSGHKGELFQVLISLISNAIEALQQTDTPKQKIWITLQDSTHHIILSIEDNAGGVAEAPIEKIFEPYYTTKSAQGGSGLGLYIAKIIVERNMQGTLAVENTCRGAKFTLKLPR